MNCAIQTVCTDLLDKLLGCACTEAANEAERKSVEVAARFANKAAAAHAATHLSSPCLLFFLENGKESHQFYSNRTPKITGKEGKQAIPPKGKNREFKKRKDRVDLRCAAQCSVT